MLTFHSLSKTVCLPGSILPLYAMACSASSPFITTYAAGTIGKAASPLEPYMQLEFRMKDIAALTYPIMYEASGALAVLRQQCGHIFHLGSDFPFASPKSRCATSSQRPPFCLKYGNNLVSTNQFWVLWGSERAVFGAAAFLRPLSRPLSRPPTDFRFLAPIHGW
jgi:hypothetical protein